MNYAAITVTDKQTLITNKRFRKHNNQATRANTEDDKNIDNTSRLFVLVFGNTSNTEQTVQLCLMHLF